MKQNIPKYLNPLRFIVKTTRHIFNFFNKSYLTNFSQISNVGKAVYMKNWPEGITLTLKKNYTN